ncbi:MAG: alpha/beta hydrolase, partial [Aquaticitalea sp.]
MKKKDFIINNEFAHYYFLKSDGDDAHFYPGNGLQNGVYKPLLNLLAEKYNLTSLAYRASWQGSPKQKNQVDWNVYADDLISFLDQKYKKPITAIGHSQGATATLMAATKRPDLFKELFLIEPVSVTKAQEIAIGLVPYFIKKKAEPFKSGLKKKPIW